VSPIAVYKHSTPSEWFGSPDNARPSSKAALLKERSTLYALATYRQVIPTGLAAGRLRAV
jgi:hypothetical protein